MKIQLSDHFTLKKLLVFTLPSIVMMIFTSIYSVVDGFFVSNFVGETPFAAVNFIMPFLMMLGAVGSMLGTGGSALIAKTLGEGDREKANRLFSLFIYVSILAGIVISVAAFLLIGPIAAWLGAEGELLENSVRYGRIILCATPAFMLQYEFQSLFVTAEQPKLGLDVTLLAGVTNIVLDALFIAVFDWGLVGAAVATALGQCVGGIIPLIYFFSPNKSLLRLGKTRYDGKAMAKACGNGSSEFLANISMSLVSMIYNVQLLKYAGEGGVAAYGVLMYVSMIFIAIFIGFSVGSAPLIGFNLGAGNHAELKNLLKKNLWFISVTSVLMTVAAEVLARPLAQLFVGYNPELMELTLRGFVIFSFNFLFCGLAIYGSSFFTALNNGLVSALISFLRTLVFQIAAVLIFPLLWGIAGIWFSLVAAEFMAALLVVIFLAANKKKYQY